MNDVPLREHLEALREADQRAHDAAFEAAKEKAERHNELIAAMERQQATFVTKDQVRWAFMALIGGAGLVTAAYAAFGGFTT